MRRHRLCLPIVENHVSRRPYNVYVIHSLEYVIG